MKLLEVIFNRFIPTDLTVVEQKLFEKVLNKYLLGIFISRNDDGKLLYAWKIDPDFEIDLAANFVHALAMFSDSVEYRRVFIEGIDVEMNLYAKDNLQVSIFFHPKMVTDYLEVEGVEALEAFLELFGDKINQKPINEENFYSFDGIMFQFIQDYLIRLNILRTDTTGANAQIVLGTHN